MIHFLDTSALVKRYVAEPGSTEVRRLFRASMLGVARIAYAELAAAVARRQREGALTMPAEALGLAAAHQSTSRARAPSASISTAT